ncbi:MAG TPA: tetratricopeptide repeat protein, partial [Burkholderiales bacterium]|nr:tetratricopeptide repeat protein [Burkholderiales bacterium]
MLGSVLKRLLRRIAPGPRATGWLEESAALHSAGRYADAAVMCRAQLARVPGDTDALQGLAAALLAQGQSAEGLAHLREAARLTPEEPDLHATVASIEAAHGEIESAIASYRHALALRPGAEAWRLQAVALLKALQRYDEAEDCCRESVTHTQATAALHHALAGVLFEQGRVDESLEELRAARMLSPRSAAIHSDTLRALNYVEGDPEAVYREHLAWDAEHAKALHDPSSLGPRDTRPVRRLRIGYVSPYFRKHAVTFFLESVIENHDRDAFEIMLYADVTRPDEYSERLKAHGALWRSTVGLDDQAMADMVRADGVDILVDLSGHTPGNRLLAFARRAAPVQVTWNGYPNTTGMTAMDYRITDALCDPPGLTERLHTEQLVRLPGIYMSWRPPDTAPEPGPLPARAAGAVTFGSFNSCFKITPRTVSLWSKVLHAVPGSRLVLLTVSEGRAAARVRDAFASHGIGAERLKLAARTSHEGFLAAHRDVDIALDAFPYHGTTTTCFSLWMGVPVVTLAGVTHVSRVGLSLLTSVGLPELAARDDDEYVTIAVSLAGNLERLGALRAGLRERMLRSV